MTGEGGTHGRGLGGKGRNNWIINTGAAKLDLDPFMFFAKGTTVSGTINMCPMGVLRMCGVEKQRGLESSVPVEAVYTESQPTIKGE